MSRKVKIGIIGVGTIGSVHADAYAKVADADVVALCDINPETLKAKSARHGVARTYADYHDLLADPEIEAVSICVPNDLHAPIAIDAFKAGKHVLLEKPMCLNAGLARQIVAARDASGKLLQMGMVRRQCAEADVIRPLIAAGQLGKIYQINIKQIRRRGIPGLGGWFTTKARSGGGGVIDIAVHSLDLALYLTGLWNPTAVSAKTYSKFGSPIKDYHYVSMWAGPPKPEGVFDVDDYATGFIRFGAEATLTFQVAWACNSTPEDSIEIIGDKGALYSTLAREERYLGEVKFYPFDGKGDLETTTFEYFDKIHYNGGPYVARHFLDLMCGKTKTPFTTVEQAFTAEALGFAAMKSSAEKSRFVEIDEIIPEDMKSAIQGE